MHTVEIDTKRQVHRWNQWTRPNLYTTYKTVLVASSSYLSCKRSI